MFVYVGVHVCMYACMPVGMHLCLTQEFPWLIKSLKCKGAKVFSLKPLSPAALKANSGVRKSVGRKAYYAQTGIYI